MILSSPIGIHCRTSRSTPTYHQHGAENQVLLGDGQNAGRAPSRAPFTTLHFHGALPDAVRAVITDRHKMDNVKDLLVGQSKRHQ